MASAAEQEWVLKSVTEQSRKQLNKNTMLTRKTRKHRNEVPVVGKEKNKNKLYHLLKVRNLYKLYIKNQGHCV